MSQRFKQLSAKHQQLRLRSALQRRALGEVATDIEQRLLPVDRGISAVRGFVRRPGVIAIGIGVLALLGPRRVLGYASRSALFVSLARSVLGRVTGKS